MPTIDVSTHARFWHNTETVTLHQRGYASGVETDTATTVTYALRRALNQTDLRTLELSQTATAVVWDLPSADIDTDPQPQDYIADGDGVNWSIQRADKQTFGARWRCVCVKQVA